MASLDVDQTLDGINRSCRNRGGRYGQYSCKRVLWDDSSTATPFGTSSAGLNIADIYLKAKDGRALFTVRPDNWNEKLGCLGADKIAVPTTNEPAVLSDVLRNIGTHVKHAGLDHSTSLHSPELDPGVLIRFQTTFLPRMGLFGAHPKIAELCSYQATSDQKNLLLLCTRQGLSVQQNGARATKLSHHSVSFGTSRHSHHWLESEGSTNSVGQETAQDRAGVFTRGKVIPSGIGPQCLGNRSDCLMTVEVPLQQEQTQVLERTTSNGVGGSTLGLFGSRSLACGTPAPSPFGPPAQAPFNPFERVAAPVPCESSVPIPFAPSPGQEVSNAAGVDKNDTFGTLDGVGGSTLGLFGWRSQACGKPAPSPFGPPVQAPFNPFQGASTLVPFESSVPTPCVPSPGQEVSNGAGVKKNDTNDGWSGFKVRSPKRHESQRITITIMLFKVVSGRVPSEADVLAAIDELENLYVACSAKQRSEPGIFKCPGAFDFSNVPVAATALPSKFPSPAPQVKLSVLQEPNPDLFGGEHFRPFGDFSSSSLKDYAKGLSLERKSIDYLQSLASVRLDDTGASIRQIEDSFSLSRLANEIHVQMTGRNEATCLYDMACCYSRLAAAVQESAPQPVHLKLSSEQCIDVSLSWLVASVGAGWQNTDHMKVDVDLQMLRQGRPAPFQAVVDLAMASKRGFQ